MPAQIFLIICELAARGCLVLTLSKQSIKFNVFVLFIRIVLFYNIPLTEQDSMLIIRQTCTMDIRALDFEIIWKN